MRFSELIHDLPHSLASPDQSDVEVRRVVHSAQQSSPGDVFVAMPGGRHDGHDFAPEAVRRGAAAIVAERPCADGVPCALVPNARQAFARLCTTLAGHPTRELALTAVTGTNGKTTTSYLIEHCLRTAGRRTGLVGTVEIRYPGVSVPSSMTTPDADVLQAHFRAMVDRGVAECVMEASSHALAGHRLDASHLDVAVFTNLQHDHLDHHGSMESYFAAKHRLFALLDESCKSAKCAVVNRDDAWGERLWSTLSGERLSCSLERSADVRGSWRPSGRGSLLRVDTPQGSFSVRLPLGGRHNASNALLAIAAVLARGLPPAVVAQALADPPPVPGRRQRIEAGGLRHVYVDFAHNPEGLTAMLEDMRWTHPGARILLVFGAKGRDRDVDKRRRMGAAAARGADAVILTSDDPYDEDPSAIAAAILRGFPPGAPVDVVLDRRLAIRQALRRADPGDVVVVAGRGPEPDQKGPEGLVPFDDAAVVQEELSLCAADVGVPVC